MIYSIESKLMVQPRRCPCFTNPFISGRTGPPRLTQEGRDAYNLGCMHLDIDGGKQCLQHIAISTEACISLSGIRAEMIMLRTEIADQGGWVSRFLHMM